MCIGRLINPCIVFDTKYISPGNAIINIQTTVSRIVAFISPVSWVFDISFFFFYFLLLFIWCFWFVISVWQDKILLFLLLFSFILASRGQPCLLLPVSVPYNINKRSSRMGEQLRLLTWNVSPNLWSTVQSVLGMTYVFVSLAIRLLQHRYVMC